MTKDDAESLLFGDVVFLRSGGPFMTVFRLGGIDEHGGRMVDCVWFAQNDHRITNQLEFHSEMLEKTGAFKVKANMTEITVI